MKKLLPYLLILIVIPSLSQDYKLFNGTSKKVFSTLIVPYSTYSLAIESTSSNENDSIYNNFIDLSSDWIESENCEFWGGPICTQQNVLVWTGKKIVFDNNHSYQFYNINYDTLNFSFDTDLDGPIQFFRDSIQEFSMLYEKDDTITVLNYLDSARFFRIVHNDLNGNAINSQLNGQHIVISKNFGLTQFFVIDSFPSVLIPMVLLGNVNPNAGFYQLTNEMVYDYQPGDEIQFNEYSRYEGYQPPWLNFNRYRKLKFLERHETTDSLIYKIKQDLFYIDSIGIQSDTITIKYFRLKVIAQIPFEKFDWRKRKLQQTDYCSKILWTYSTNSHNDASYCEEDTCWGSRDVPGPPEHRITSIACGLGIYDDDRYVVGPDGYHIKYKIVYFKKNDFTCGNEVVVDINEIKNPEFDIILGPNPANEVLNISSTDEIQKIMLIDITGNVQLLKSISSRELTIDISQFSEGIYFVSVLFHGGELTTKKLIVLKN